MPFNQKPVMNEIGRLSVKIMIEVLLHRREDTDEIWEFLRTALKEGSILNCIFLLEDELLLQWTPKEIGRQINRFGQDIWQMARNRKLIRIGLRLIKLDRRLESFDSVMEPAPALHVPVLDGFHAPPQAPAIEAQEFNPAPPPPPTVALNSFPSLCRPASSHEFLNRVLICHVHVNLYRAISYLYNKKVIKTMKATTAKLESLTLITYTPKFLMLLYFT